MGSIASHVQSKHGFRDDARKLFVEIPRFDLTLWKTVRNVKDPRTFLWISIVFLKSTNFQ